MMADREIVADYVDHVVGERETVDWTRPDGQTYRNVPLMYIRRASEAEYLEGHPHMHGRVPPERPFFWEVSVD